MHHDPGVKPAMQGYESSSYGDRIAGVYDDWYSVNMDPTPVVEALSRMAAGGDVLELGVGTGRIAIPLAATGLNVWGIEISLAMVEKLRAKPGGGRVHVIVGDFADVAVQRRFSLIYAPFTTFFALPTQSEQLRCLANIARRLAPGGAFIMDAFVPRPERYRDNQRVAVQHVGADHLLLEAAEHDAVGQRIDSLHVAITEHGIRIFPVVLRYAWPAELDAMALASGLVLKNRFNDYESRPFTSSSVKHVSVYRLNDHGNKL